MKSVLVPPLPTLAEPLANWPGSDGKMIGSAKNGKGLEFSSLLATPRLDLDALDRPAAPMSGILLRPEAFDVEPSVAPAKRDPAYILPMQDPDHCKFDPVVPVDQGACGFSSTLTQSDGSCASCGTEPGEQTLQPRDDLECAMQYRSDAQGWAAKDVTPTTGPAGPGHHHLYNLQVGPPTNPQNSGAEPAAELPELALSSRLRDEQRRRSNEPGRMAGVVVRHVSIHRVPVEINTVAASIDAAAAVAVAPRLVESQAKLPTQHIDSPGAGGERHWNAREFSIEARIHGPHLSERHLTLEGHSLQCGSLQSDLSTPTLTANGASRQSSGAIPDSERKDIDFRPDSTGSSATAGSPEIADQLVQLIGQEFDSLQFRWVVQAHRSQPTAGAPSEQLIVGPRIVRQLQVELEPVDLGRVTVRMELTEGGLSLRVEAEIADTARAISGSLDELSRGLLDVGYRVDGISVRHVTTSGSGPLDAGIPVSAGGSEAKSDPTGQQPKHPGHEQRRQSEPWTSRLVASSVDSIEHESSADARPSRRGIFV